MGRERRAHWRTSAEGEWDPRQRTLDGWSHTQWFGPAGEFLGEEWRRFSDLRGTGPEPDLRRAGDDQVNRLADLLMLAGVAVLFLTAAFVAAAIR